MGFAGHPAWTRQGQPRPDRGEIREGDPCEELHPPAQDIADSPRRRHFLPVRRADAQRPERPRPVRPKQPVPHPPRKRGRQHPRSGVHQQGLPAAARQPHGGGRRHRMRRRRATQPAAIRVQGPVRGGQGEGAHLPGHPQGSDRKDPPAAGRRQLRPPVMGRHPQPRAGRRGETGRRQHVRRQGRSRQRVPDGRFRRGRARRGRP